MALVGRYETYEQLGKGSTGTVYRARDVVLRREVAIKILNANSRFSSRLLDLFFTDEQSASEWLHPNIAIIHDLGETSAGTFIATEYLTGTTLREHIRNRGDYSLVQKLDLIIQACNGLAHAHRNGVVHAALTPQCFFVNKRQQVKILDLGIRHIARSLPEAGENFGDLDYLAPEQVWEKTCDIRSDLFSAAVVFYEFLVNVHPFGSTFIPRRIMEEPPDSLFLHDRSLPPSLEHLLNRTLNKAPADRPQSALELAASFRAIELEVSPTMMHRFGDRPRFPDRSRVAPGKSWEGHSNVRAFLELLRRFDENVAAEKWSEAQQLLQTMKSLSSVPDDQEFVAAILDCERQLARAQKIEAPVSEVIAAPESTGNGTKWDGRVSDPAPVPDLPVVVTSPSEPVRTVTKSRIRVPTVVVITVLLLLVAYLASWLGQGSAKAILARAQVSASETPMLESSNAESRALGTLTKDSWVSVLDRIPGREDRFVHVQFKTDRQEMKSGYVRIADLHGWSSDDPENAWNLLSLAKPAATSDGANVQRYLTDLQVYRARFPTSKRAHAADVEIEYWNQILARTPEPSLGAITNQVSDRTSDVAAAYKASTPASSAVTLSPANRDKLQHMLDQMPTLWNDGNLEGIIDLTQKALVLDRGNPIAKDWNAKARKALRKLNSQ